MDSSEFYYLDCFFSDCYYFYDSFLAGFTLAFNAKYLSLAVSASLIMSLFSYVVSLLISVYSIEL